MRRAAVMAAVAVGLVAPGVAQAHFRMVKPGHGANLFCAQGLSVSKFEQADSYALGKVTTRPSTIGNGTTTIYALGNPFRASIANYLPNGQRGQRQLVWNGGSRRLVFFWRCA